MKTQQFLRGKTFFFTVLICVYLCNIGYAQNRAMLDSIRAEATLLTYSNPELAIEKGLKLVELSNDAPSSQISGLFIGGEYQRLKLGNKALNYLDKAYELSLQQPLPDSLKFLQGNIVFVKGLIQKDNLGCEYAMQYLLQAEEIFKNNLTSKAINTSLGIANNNIGDCYIELGEYEKAKENYNEAILFATKVNSVKIIAYSELGLSKIFSAKGEYLEAINILQKALSSLENINDIAMYTQIYKALSENYSEIEDTENFNKYTSLYLAEEDKLLNEEKKSLNTIVNDISLDNSEKSEAQENKYFYLFIISGMLLLIFLIYIINKIIKKRRKIAKHRKEVDSAEKSDE